MTVSEPSASLPAHPQIGRESFPAFGAAPSSRPSGRAGAHLLLWLGLLLLAVVTAVLYTHGTYVAAGTVQGTVVFALYGLVYAGFGLLSRRGGLVPVAAVLWLLATVAFVLPQTSRFDLLLVVSLTLYNAAYLVVRRTSGLGYLFLILTAALEALWVMEFDSVNPADRIHLLGQFGAVAVTAFLFMAGATALLAPATLLAGLVSGTAARRPPAIAAWPGQPAYAAQPVHPGQPAYQGEAVYPVQAPYPPPPAPAGYAQAQYGYAAPYGYAPAASRTNTLAIVALVLGLVGISLGGVICGHIALSQIRRTGEGGRGLAIAGLVLGYVWIALSVIVLVVLVGAASRYGSY